MIFWIIVPFTVMFAISQKEISSKVTGVTVFFNGSQVVREASLNIQAGSHNIVISDLPQYMNPNTVVVESESALTLLSVKHNLNYMKNQEKPKEVVKMEDSLKILQQSLQFKNSMLQVYREEEAMLLSNKSIRGENNGVQADNLKNTTEYFRTRLIDIKTRQNDLTLEIQKINEHIQKLNNQISQTMSNRGGPVSEITITLSAKSSVSGKLRISYFVNNASWSPMYDIRANEIGKPIQLNLKANVINNTGENWDNVSISLSSANPTESGIKPILYPWYLYPYNPVKYDYRDSQTKSEAAPASVAYGATMDEEKNLVTSAVYTTVQQNMTTIEYKISLPYTIPSDGKEYTVDIQEYSMPAVYEYQCVPKLDKDAFLIARITGWENYNLLPGNTNLFAEGKFLGNSYIDPGSVKDTLDISLGRDKSISINREVLKDFSSEKMIGTNKTITRTYEISIRNRKSNAIYIVAEDQIPLSNQKDIVIEFDPKRADGAEYTEATGMLKWKLNIKPGETAKIKYSYTVKHPKEMNVQVW